MANLENKKAGSKEHWQKVTDKAQAREARTDALYQLEKVGFTYLQASELLSPEVDPDSVINMVKEGGTTEQIEAALKKMGE